MLYLMLAGSVLAGFGYVGATAQDALDIEATPRTATSPATVRVTATVEPHEENRELRIVADSGEYFSSSSVALDGDAAPRTHTSVLKGLPAGTYELRAVVIQSDGERITAGVTVRIWK